MLDRAADVVAQLEDSEDDRQMHPPRTDRAGVEHGDARRVERRERDLDRLRAVGAVTGRTDVVAVHLDQAQPGYDGAKLVQWLEDHEYSSVAQLRGRLRGYALSTVDEAMTLLSGCEAGIADEVGEFIATIRRSIGERPDTVVFFQIPNARYVLCDVAFWDIYYEHCSYFTPGSLARLFRRSGFEVLDAAARDHRDRRQPGQIGDGVEHAVEQPGVVGMGDDRSENTVDVEREVGTLGDDSPPLEEWSDPSFVESYLERFGEQ